MIFSRGPLHVAIWSFLSLKVAKSLELAGYCGSVAKFRKNINFKSFVVALWVSYLNVLLYQNACNNDLQFTRWPGISKARMLRRPQWISSFPVAQNLPHLDNLKQPLIILDNLKNLGKPQRILDKLREYWTTSNNLGQPLTALNNYGQPWTISENLTALDNIRQSRRISDNLWQAQPTS